MTGQLSLLSVGILFGLSGVFAKYLSGWMNPYLTVAFRFGIAFLLAAVGLILTKQKFDITKVNKTKLALFAVSFPAQAIFFTLSVFYTKVALAVFAFYIANLLSSFLLGFFLFNEKIDTKKAFALICIIGSLMCFTNPLQGFNINAGFMFGLIAGVVQTVASIFQKTIGEKTNKLSLLMVQTFAGTMMAALAMLVTSTLFIPEMPLPAVSVTVLFGAVFLLISYLLLIGFQKMNLNVGTLLISSELLFGPAFAFLLFHESLGMLEVIGGLLTIVAVVVVNSDFLKREKVAAG